MTIRTCAPALVALALAGCGSSEPEKYFETRGLRPPVNACTADPADVAVARKIPDVDGRSSCGVENAYEVSAVSGVAMSQKATVNCGVIGPLARWMSDSVQPAARNAFGAEVVQVKVAASYACRPRNNQRGARMSEHGYGNAIDISGFVLSDGREVTVAEGWRGSSDERSFLRQVRAEGCGPFTTVLGPGSDRHHHDHLHFDLARHGRAGTGHYCR